MTPHANDDLLNQADLKTYLKNEISEPTLEKWRCTGQGPAFIKAGRKVLYRQSAVDAWLANRTVSHTHQAIPVPNAKRHPRRRSARA